MGCGVAVAPMLGLAVTWPAGWLPPPAAAAQIEAARISARPPARMMISLRRHHGGRGGGVPVSKPGGWSGLGWTWVSPSSREQG